MSNNKIYGGNNILLYIGFFVFFLSACTMQMNNDDCCRVNGDLKYLNTDVLSELNIKDKNITLPDVCWNYYIPNYDINIGNPKMIGKEVNICPPNLPKDILEEFSCKNKDSNN